MNVLVTGGTGRLGRPLVTLLRNQGHRARILTRSPKGHVDAVQGDLSTGEGLLKAVTGMDAIIHAATQLTNQKAADVIGTRRLLAMGREAGLKHVVYVSIVGIEGVDYPYYRTKLAAEAIVKENILPWSILRATQFHTLMETFLRAFTTPPLIAPVPFSWQFQPVDPSEVAARLVQVVTQAPKGMLSDFGGPEVRDFKSLATSWLKAKKSTKRLVNLPMPLIRFSRQFSEGRLLTPDHKDGKITFEQYLQEKYEA